MDELITKICSLSDEQIDAPIKDRLRVLIGLPPALVVPELKAILDDCAYGARATDFVMLTLDTVKNLAICAAAKELDA